MGDVFRFKQDIQGQLSRIRVTENLDLLGDRPAAVVAFNATTESGDYGEPARFIRVATRAQALQVLALEEGKVAGVLARSCAEVVDGFEAGVLQYGDPLYAIAQVVLI